MSWRAARHLLKCRWNELERRRAHTEVQITSPLEGIRILDLSRVLAGPFATMILGDLGAEVIKVERPGSGDETRQWGPPFLEGSGERESAYFLSVNRNKKSICLDMSSKQGQNILRDLAGVSDVLVENFLPGKLGEYGLDYLSLSTANPALIYCSITGFGQDGPYSKRGGYDVIAASIGGLTHVTGERDSGPMKVGVAVTDLATALYAHGAILAALLQRSKTGRGQHIDCNLLSTQVSMMVNLASNYLNAGIIPGRWGTGHASIVPYQTFRTKDGYLTIACGSNAHFRELCAVLGSKEFADREEYKNNEDRVCNREVLVGHLTAILVQQSTAEWCRRFEGASFPYGPVNTMDQVFQDPQVRHNRLQQKVEHSTLGTIHQVGPAVLYSHARNAIRSAPPLLGQHTEEILAQLLGYDESKLESLKRGRVIA